MNGHASLLERIFRQHWLTLAMIIFLAGVAITIAQWFSFSISDDIPDLLLIVSLAMYLLSEKIQKRSLSVLGRAFSYFSIYTLLFFVIERHARMGTLGVLSYSIVFITFLTLASIILYQVRYFRLRTRDKATAGYVMMFGILAIISMTTAVTMSFKLLSAQVVKN